MKKHLQIILLTLVALTFMAIAPISSKLTGAVEIDPSPAPVVPSEVALASTPMPQPTITPTPTLMPVKAGQFELQIRGATGFTTVEMNLRLRPSPSSQLLRKVRPGAAFRILEEQGEYWNVENDDFSGWLAHKYCMINLPDVIPSIIYENTNASESRVKSSGKDVPGITGKQLYNSKAFNERLGREEFIMPTLYSMAWKICAAQQAALREGNSLKIYEAYRPYSAQRTMVDALATLAEHDADVKQGISAQPWKVSWFISLGTSNHQRGLAIDVSLVNVKSIEIQHSGEMAYNTVRDYTEYDMPSPIHELSIASAAFSAPVPSTSTSAWESAAPAKAMNKAALSLQRYCTVAGLTPLASEWWHFNDLSSEQALGDNKGQGQTVLTELFSVSPN